MMFFFFQAEDGIRDIGVTGVQTCALPILFLESLEHAQKRGAQILAEIVGYGMSGDAYHITQPAEDGGGAFPVMRAALKEAKLSPEDIGYVNAHGTSAPLGDAVGTKGLKRGFCQRGMQ